MSWPAGEIDKISTLYNVYKAYHGYTHSSDTTAFQRQNGAAFALVTDVWNLRKANGRDWWTGAFLDGKG